MITLGPTLLQPAMYCALVARIGRIQSNSLRQWGRMSAEQMLCHCAAQIRLALAQKPATERATWFNRTIGIRVALALPRIPLRNLATPRDMRQDGAGLSTPPTNLPQDKQLLLTALADFRHRPPGRPLAPHPGYGRLSRAEWGVSSTRTSTTTCASLACEVPLLFHTAWALALLRSECFLLTLHNVFWYAVPSGYVLTLSHQLSCKYPKNHALGVASAITVCPLNWP